MAAAETTFRVMASDAQVIVIDGPADAGAMAKRLLHDLERVWSRFIDHSDISRLNRGAGHPVAVSAPTLLLVDTMIAAWRLTDGRYDPTIAPALVEAGYPTSARDTAATDQQQPAGRKPAIVASSFGATEVNHDAQTITLPLDLSVDAGGIGKGLAADVVVADLLDRGATGALVNIGGDLAAAGASPYDDGWPIAVEDPFNPNELLLTMTVSGGGVATSSTRSRTWIAGEAEQHHVIDPTTRRPAETDLIAVTAIGTCGWHAEAVATSLLLDGASEIGANHQHCGVTALAVTTDHRVLTIGQLAGMGTAP